MRAFRYRNDRLRRKREAGFIVTLEFLLITTFVLYLLIVVWTALQARLIERLREIRAQSAQSQPLQPAHPATARFPSSPAAIAPPRVAAPGVEDSPAVPYPITVGGLRFAPPPTAGTARIGSAPPPR